MGDACDKLLSSFDKIMATMEEMKALMRNQRGHCQQGGLPISVTKKYPYLFQNHRSIATPTTAPAKPPGTSDPVPSFFDLPKTDGDDIEKSQIKDNPIADPASDANSVLDPVETPNTAEEDFSDHHQTPYDDLVADSVSVIEDELVADRVTELTNEPKRIFGRCVGKLASFSVVDTHSDASHVSDQGDVANPTVADVPHLVTRPYDPGPFGSPPRTPVHTPLYLPNFKHSLDVIFLPSFLNSVLSVNSGLMIIWLNASHRNEEIVAPVFFTLNAGNVVFPSLRTVLQVFEQIPKGLVVVWNAIINGCVAIEHEGATFDLYKDMPRMNMEHGNYTSTSMLSLGFFELLHSGRHVHFGVNSPILMCFIFSCVLDAYEGLGEAGPAFCDLSTYNDMKDGFVSMDRLEDALVMFKDMHWACFDPIEASCGSRATLAICGTDDIMNGNSFEFSLIGCEYMGAGDKNKKNQDQNCWVCQKEKLSVLTFVDKDSKVLKLEKNSLEYLLHHFCEVTANKEYQNADWRLHSFPDKMIIYAREEVYDYKHSYGACMLILKFNSGLVIIMMSLSEWEYCHMILGAQWLSKLGPSLWNISRLPMEFFDEGEGFELRKPEILTLPTAIEGHNTTLGDLFAKLRHLPLCKWGIDHRIYLQGGSSTFNLQPCRYCITQMNLGFHLIILCDDVLESEELKAKMNICEESNAGMEYSHADILTAENGPRKVQLRYTKFVGCRDEEKMKFPEFVFIKLNVVCWTEIIHGYAHNGIAVKGFSERVYGPYTVQGIFGVAACQLELFPESVIPVMFSVFQLKLCTELVFISAHPLPKQPLLVQKWDGFVSILHRKMIDRGRVHIPLVLLKWKTLPPKHGTWRPYYDLFKNFLHFILEDKDVLKGRVLLQYLDAALL